MNDENHKLGCSCGMLRAEEVRLAVWAGEDWEVPLTEFAVRLGFPRAEIRKLPGGKPVFDPTTGLHFSISNTAGLQVAALALFPVGVDVERTSRTVSFRRIAGKYFFPSEREWLFEAPEGSPAEAERFFRLWTAKEAVVKLDGMGLYAGGLCGARTLRTGNFVSGAVLDGRHCELKNGIFGGDFLVTVAAFQDFLLALDGDFPKVL